MRPTDFDTAFDEALEALKAGRFDDVDFATLIRRIKSALAGDEPSSFSATTLQSVLDMIKELRDARELVALKKRLMACDPALNFDEAIARYRVLLGRVSGAKDKPSVSRLPFDALEELADASELVERLLECGDFLTLHISLRRHEEAMADAEKRGVDVTPHRRLRRRADVAIGEWDIHTMLREIDYGERPPECLTPYEKAVARCRALGLDVREVEAALDRAREIMDSDDWFVDEWRGPVAMPGSSGFSARQMDEAVPRPATSSSVAGPQVARSHPATPTSNEPAGRAAVEEHITALATRLGHGDGGAALRSLAGALLGLHVRDCVQVKGNQLALVEHLVDVGALDKKPGVRAARAAIRKLVGETPIVERANRTLWIYHLDELREPSREFLARIVGHGSRDA